MQSNSIATGCLVLILVDASRLLQPEALNPWERYLYNSLTFREIPPDTGFFLEGVELYLHPSPRSAGV